MEKIALIDFDKTITRIDSGLYSSLYGFPRRPWLLLLFLVSRFFSPENNARFKYLYAEADVGTRATKNVRSRVLRHLAYVRKRGYTIAIVTGSPRSAVEPYLKSFPEFLGDNFFFLEEVWRFPGANLAEKKCALFFELASSGTKKVYFLNDNLDEIRFAKKSGWKVKQIF